MEKRLKLLPLILLRLTESMKKRKRQRRNKIVWMPSCGTSRPTMVLIAARKMFPGGEIDGFERDHGNADLAAL